MEYSLRNIKVAEVQSAVNTVLSSVKTDAVLREEASKAGIDLQAMDAALATEPHEQLIQVKQKGIGLDPATTAVIVAFAPVAAKIVRDIWDYLILPRIRSIHGPEAVKLVRAQDGK